MKRLCLVLQRLFLLLLLGPPLGMVGCGDDGGSSVQPITLEGLTVSAVDAASVDVGGTAGFAVTQIAVRLGDDAQATNFDDLSEEGLNAALEEGTLNEEQKGLIQEAVDHIVWSTEDSAVASVEGDGVSATATGKAAGETHVVARISVQYADVATYNEQQELGGDAGAAGYVSGSAELTVTAPEPVLTAISAEIDDATISVGDTSTITVTATYDDGTEVELAAADVTFSSSNADVASVAAGVVTGEDTGEASIEVSFEGETDSVDVVVSAAELESIELSADNADNLAAGATLQVTAVGTYSDGSTADITNVVSWSSSDNDIADVNSEGEVEGVSEGEATITAALDGIEGTLDVTVTGANVESIEVEVEDTDLAVGQSTQLSATATLGDGSTVDIDPSDCTSDNEDVATVDADGVVTAVGAGTAVIACAFGGEIGSVTITVTAKEAVSLTVEGPDGEALITANVGQAVQLHAIVTYTDGSTEDVSGDVEWSVDDEDIASVNASGELSALGDGGAVVTATLGELSADIAVSVGNTLPVSLTVTADADSVPDGTPVQLTATVEFEDGSIADVTEQVVWTVTDGEATVDDEGLVDTTGAFGNQTIEAEYQDLTGEIVIAVSSAIPTSLEISPAVVAALPRGLSQQLVATAYFSDGSSHAVAADWSSDDEDALTVDEDGLATASPEAEAVTVTVTASYDAGGETVTDTVEITISTATPVSLDLSPLTADVPVGFTLPFTATLTLSDDSTLDVTEQVAWSSSDALVATVGTGTGITTGVAAGTSEISAIHGASALESTAPAVLTVTTVTLSRITVAPAKAAIARGTTQQFTATGTFSDGSQLDITRDVSWTVVQPTCGEGGDQCLTAQGGNYVTISNDNEIAGLATGVQATSDIEREGDNPAAADEFLWYATIRATSQSGAISNTARLAVTTDSITEVVVLVLDDGDAADYDANPSNDFDNIATLPIGVTGHLRAYCTFEDTTRGDCTELVTFTGSGSNAALLDNAADTLVGVTFGGIAISAAAPTTAVAGVEINTVNVSVASCQYTTLVVDPPSASQIVPLGTTFQAVATLGGSPNTACNGLRVSGGSNITWTSGAPGALTASATGRFTALTNPTPAVPDAGLNVVVTGRYVVDGVDLTGTKTVSLRPACINSLTVTAAQSTVLPLIAAHSIGEQLEVSAVFSDPEVDPVDVTGAVELDYDNEDVNAAGFFTPEDDGVVTITVSTDDEASFLGGLRICQGGATGTLAITVVETEVDTLTIAGPASLAVGQVGNYTATATFEDDTVPAYDVTDFGTWSATNDPSVLDIDADGVAVGGGDGTSTVSFVLDGVTATRQVTVGGRVLQDVIVGVNPDFSDAEICGDLVLEPSEGQVGTNSEGDEVAYSTFDDVDVPVAITFPLIAVGVYSNGDWEDVTADAVFTSTAGGTITAKSLRTVTAADISVSATFGGVTSSEDARLNLTTDDDYDVVSISLLPTADVGPASPDPTDEYAAGESRDYDLIVNFTDGVSCDVSGSATWTLTQPVSPGNATVNASGLFKAGAGQQGQSLDLNVSYDGDTVVRSINVGAACAESIALTPRTGTLLYGDDSSSLNLTATVGLSDGNTLNILNPEIVFTDESDAGLVFDIDDFVASVSSDDEGPTPEFPLVARVSASYTYDTEEFPGNTVPTCDDEPLVVSEAGEAEITLLDDVVSLTLDCDDAQIDAHGDGIGTLRSGQAPVGVRGYCRALADFASAEGQNVTGTVAWDATGAGDVTFGTVVEIDGDNWIPYTTTDDGLVQIGISLGNETDSVSLQVVQIDVLQIVITDTQFSSTATNLFTLPYFAGIAYEEQAYATGRFDFTGGGSSFQNYDITSQVAWTVSGTSVSAAGGNLVVLASGTSTVTATLAAFAGSGLANTDTASVTTAADSCQAGTLVIRNGETGVTLANNTSFPEFREIPLELWCTLQNNGSVVEVTASATWTENGNAVTFPYGASQPGVTRVAAAGGTGEIRATLSDAQTIVVTGITSAPACYEALRISEVLQKRTSGSEIPVNVPLNVIIEGRLSGEADFEAEPLDEVFVAAVTEGEGAVGVVEDGIGSAGVLDVSNLCDNLSGDVDDLEYAYVGVEEELVALSISGDTTLPLGGTRQYALLATYGEFAGTWDVTFASVPGAPVWGEAPGNDQLDVDDEVVSASESAEAGESTALTAAYDSHSASLDISIGSAVLDSVTVALFRTSPELGDDDNTCDSDADALGDNFARNTTSDTNLPIGGYHTFARVIGTYTDGTEDDITDQATFEILDSAVHSVDAAGRITSGPITAGNDADTITLQASVGEFTDVTDLSIVDTTITSVDLLNVDNRVGDPNGDGPVAVAVGTNTRVFAVGTFANGNDYCVTSRASFSSAAAQVNVSGNTVTGVSTTASAVGVVVTGVLLDGSQLTADINVLVTNSTVSAVAIAPDVMSLALDPGETAQLRAFATFTDGTTGVEVTSDLTRIRWGIAGQNGIAANLNVQSADGVSINGNGVVTAPVGASGNDVDFSVYSVSGGNLVLRDTVTISVQ